MTRFVEVNGFEIYIHEPEFPYGLQTSAVKGGYTRLPDDPCGYKVSTFRVHMLEFGGGNIHQLVKCAVATNGDLFNLDCLDFWGCAALKCPDGYFRFSRSSPMDTRAYGEAAWIRQIHGTAEFVHLRGKLHAACNHMGPVAKAALWAFKVRNEFMLRPEQYAAFIEWLDEAEARELARMHE